MLLDRGLLVQEGPVYTPGGRDRLARGAGDAARADRRPPRRPLAPTSGGCSRTAPCSGRPLHLPGSRRSAGVRRRSSSRCSVGSSGRRCSASRPTRARPSTASTASSRISSATSPTKRFRSGSGARSTWRRPEYLVRALAAEESEVVEVIASHYLDAYHAAGPTPMTPRRSSARPTTRSSAPARGPRLSARPPRHAATSRAASCSTDDPLEQADAARPGRRHGGPRGRPRRLLAAPGAVDRALRGCGRHARGGPGLGDGWPPSSASPPTGTSSSSDWSTPST